MWSFLLLCSCMCIVVVVSSETVTGYRGETLVIRCPYESGYESNSKYFCKDKCNFVNKIIMVKSGSPAKDERFSLTDDTAARVFTITITGLRTADQGRYWCAVKRILPFKDVYSEILLLVKQDKRTTEVPTVSLFSIPSTRVSYTPLTHQPLSAQTSPPDSGSFVIIITAGGLALLLICAVLLTVAVRKEKTCGLVSSSTEELHVTIRNGEENAYETGNPAVVSNSRTAQSDDSFAANEFHRPPNTEAVDTDPDYMNAAAVRNSVNPDQIYTQLNASRHSHIYQSLTAGSVEEEPIYHSIHQTTD